MPIDELDVIASDDAFADALVILDSRGLRAGGTVSTIASSNVTLVLGDDDPETMIDAVEAGARGYVIREAPLAIIQEAAISLARGKAIIPPLMLGPLLQHVVQRRRSESAALGQLDALTRREHDVFELAAMGLGHDGVAERLFISPATARTHLHRIFKKLDIHSKAELVALAAACGLPTSEEA